MSEKVRNYEKESIEVCRNCKGTGIAYTCLLYTSDAADE